MGRTVGLVGLIASFSVLRLPRTPTSFMSPTSSLHWLTAIGAVAKALDGRGSGKGGRFQGKCQKVAGSSDDATNAFPKDSNRTAAC